MTVKNILDTYSYIYMSEVDAQLQATRYLFAPLSLKQGFSLLVDLQEAGISYELSKEGNVYPNW